MVCKNYNELIEELESIKDEYFKCRKEKFALLDKIDEMEIKQEQLTQLIEKISKELSYKTELLAEYHLKFGEECLEIVEKKRSRIKKRRFRNNDDEGVELE